MLLDAPVHNIPIVGGYWGFANVRDRALSQYFLKVLTNKHIAYYYNKNGRSPKQHDQWLLTKYFAPFIYDNSTTHDSYLCYWLGGDPCKEIFFNNQLKRIGFAFFPNFFDFLSTKKKADKKKNFENLLFF